MTRALAAVLLALAAGAAGFVAEPLETEEFVRALRLRAAGVTRARDGGLSVLVKDSCRPPEPCRCVALIHGLGDSAMTWDKYLRGGDGAPRPPAGTYVWAPDLPGTDRSAPPEGPEAYRVRTTARILGEAMLRRCPRWTVVGNSLGGWIGSWIALDRPEAVERLVLLNPGGMTDPTGAVIETARFLAHPTGEGLGPFDAKARAKPRPLPRWILDKAAARIAARHTAEIVAAFRPEDALDAHAQDLKVPVEVIWGDSDRLIGRGTVEKLVKLAPRAKLALIPECGHLPQQECPEKTAPLVFPAPAAL